MRVYLTTAVLLLVLPACAVPYKVGVTPTGAPQYERVRIVYSIESSESVPGTVTQLTIEYPHPAGHADLARATLHMSDASQSGATLRVASSRLGESSHFDAATFWNEWTMWWSVDKTSSTIAEMDVPRHQLDLLLCDLAHTGFFGEQNPPWPSTRLLVEVDRGRTAKPWVLEPRLDDFITRTRTAGEPSRVVATQSRDL